MPFEANRRLTAALHQPVPLVLQNYEAMMSGIKASVLELTHAVEAFRAIELRAEPHDHSDACEACTVIKNVQLRYSHDLSLLASQAKTVRQVQARISQLNIINHATSEDLLTTCLITRAALDNLVRSCALFMRHDIRIYNKYLAESLTSIQKLVWTTLPQSIDDEALPLLDAYRALNGAQRNDSELFADPFPTFTRKIEFLRGLSKDEEFNELFDMILRFYGALSDFVHGGIASLAIATPNTPQIVTGGPLLRFTPYTYQVAEFTGISLITVLETLTNLYVPALIQSLAWIDGTSDVIEQLTAERSGLMERLQHTMI